MQAYLEMKNIRKTFPGVLALDDVDFDLRQGEVHTLVGENGAGKSTLINVLFGAHKKDHGDIRIQGKSVHISHPKVAQKFGIVAVQQHFSLIPTMSVAENIYYGKYPRTPLGMIDWKRLFANAEDFLKNIGFDDLDVQAQITALSVAEAQKVEIAKAVRQQPKIIIMDEPSAVLPTSDLEKLFRLIIDLKTQQVGIIYISHHFDEVFEISDRITVLKDGKKISTILPSETDHDGLVRLMVGRDVGEMYPQRTANIGPEILAIQRLSSETLTDVSFVLHQGEVLGIAGLVGAGRTELCEAIFGLDASARGEVMIEGQPAVIRSPLEAIQRGMGFVTEDRHRTGLMLTMPVQTNITFVGHKKVSRFGILNEKIDQAVTEEYVEKMNIITPSIRQLVQLLSGGNQQKVVLAKWLFTEPKILILDEPTRGIDVGAKVEIYRLINHLVAQGLAVIMVSSELPEILGMSDRILVMRAGRIVGEFLPERTSEEEIIACASGVIFSGENHNRRSSAS